MTNPTPPQPPEMPKPDEADITLVNSDDMPEFGLYHAWKIGGCGTTSIERAYSELSRVAQQQRERAEKAEAECVANHKAYADLSARLAEKTMENARLREALEHESEVLEEAREFINANTKKDAWGSRLNRITQRIAGAQAHTQALLRTSEASEQRSPTPEATPHEEAGETTDE